MIGFDLIIFKFSEIFNTLQTSIRINKSLFITYLDVVMHQKLHLTFDLWSSNFWKMLNTPNISF